VFFGPVPFFPLDRFEVIFFGLVDIPQSPFRRHRGGLLSVKFQGATRFAPKRSVLAELSITRPCSKNAISTDAQKICFESPAASIPHASGKQKGLRHPAGSGGERTLAGHPGAVKSRAGIPPAERIVRAAIRSAQAFFFGLAFTV